MLESSKRGSHVNIYVSILFLLGIPSTEDTMSSLLTVIQTSSQSQLGSQYSECPVSEWNSGGNSTTNATSSNGQVGSVRFLCCCRLSASLLINTDYLTAPGHARKF